MSRIAFIGVLTAGAVLTIVSLHGAASEASASGDGRVCAAAWCPKELPGWRTPAPRGDEPPTSTYPTTWPKPSTSTYTKPSTTTSTTTTSSTTTSTKTTSSTTTTTSTSTTTPPVSTTTTRPTTTTTKPPTTTNPVAKPPRHQDNRLASTGASIGWLLPLGVLLLVAGGLLLLTDRNRHASRR